MLKAKIGQESFNEEVWLDIVDTADGFIDVLSDIIQFIGNLRGAEEPAVEVDSMEAFNDVTKWMRTSVDGIEAENTKITALIDSLSNDQLLWMSSSLVNLVPDRSNCTLLRDISCPITVNHSFYRVRTVHVLLKLRYFDEKHFNFNQKRY